MLQNTYGNKGLDTLFGPGRIPDFWTPIVKNIHVFVHPIKKPSQAQGFWTYIHASGCLLVRSFRKHNTQLASLSWPKPVCLWWFLHFQARCMYVCMHAGIWKLKKSSFDQALQNASKHLQKFRFGQTFWQNIWIFGLQKPPMPNSIRTDVEYAWVDYGILMRRVNPQYVCILVLI